MTKTMSWTTLHEGVLLDTMEVCDAHPIVRAEAFRVLGVPAELVARYDSSHGGEELRDGNCKVVKAVKVVGCSTRLEMICHDRGLLGSYLHDRGMQACQMKSPAGVVVVGRHARRGPVVGSTKSSMPYGAPGRCPRKRSVGSLVAVTDHSGRMEMNRDDKVMSRGEWGAFHAEDGESYLEPCSIRVIGLTDCPAGTPVAVESGVGT